MTTSRPPWSPPVKLTVILLLLGLSVYLLYLFKAVIIPFILALILAYVLTPLVNRHQKRSGWARGPSTLFVYAIFLLMIILIPAVLVPTLTAQSAELNQGIRNILIQVETLMGSSYTFMGQTVNPQAMIEDAAGSVGALLEPFFTQGLQFAIEAISSLVWLIFILVIAFYLIKDGSVLQAWLEGLVPQPYHEDYLHLRVDIAEIWSAFFRGQITLALVVAVMFTVVAFILGLPFALAMGVLAGLLEFLPSIGHAIWLVIAVTLALFAGSTWLPLPNWAFALLILGLHLFYQQFDLNYLIPRIIGRRVHLPPLVVILGIVTGALMAGVLGVVLAAPTIASLRILGRYIYANLLDLDPFPSPAATLLPPPNATWWRKQGAASPDPTRPSGQP